MTQVVDPDVPARDNWGGQLDFILSSIGFAVGLGNIWRFPYLAQKNGGASFLIPYLIMLACAGVPLFFLEMAIGQFTSQGPITCWEMAPVFTGVGVGMVIVNIIVSVYYNMIIAWAVYYMFVCFTHMGEDVPWETCDPDWATAACTSEPVPDLTKLNQSEQVKALYGDLMHQTCVDKTMNISTYADYNATTSSSELFSKFVTGLVSDQNCNVLGATVSNITSYTLSPICISKNSGFSSCAQARVSPSEEYFERYVLDNTAKGGGDLDDLGSVSLKLVLSNLLTWIVVFVCLFKGVKSSGKVVYFTATFPYVVLIVLLVRGLTLDGFEEGIEYYVVPDWDKLTDSDIWLDAANQIFYSLGVGFGGLLTMASYNKFHDKLFRDTLIVAGVNSATSVFGGFAIFALIGHMAHVTNQDIDNLSASGTGLAFVVCADGLAELPGAAIWAFLFFFMLVTLGLDSQFVGMECIISAIVDLFPNYLRKRKMQFTLISCVVGFLLGIPLCAQRGKKLLELMDDYCAWYNLMIMTFLECICMCYVYGIKNFLYDIEMMVGKKPKAFMGYWVANWMVITPAALLFIVIASAIDHDDSGYVDWAVAFGWVMIVLPLVAVVVMALYKMVKMRVQAFKPTRHWRPALAESREGTKYDDIGKMMNQVTGGGEADLEKDPGKAFHNMGYDDAEPYKTRL